MLWAILLWAILLWAILLWAIVLWAILLWAILLVDLLDTLSSGYWLPSYLDAQDSNAYQSHPGWD